MRLFKGNWKYVLAQEESYQTYITGYHIVDPNGYYELFKSGRLLVRKNYASDGPSGPTFDTKLFVWAAICHDVLYQMIRQGYLTSDMREVADKLLYEMLLEGRLGRNDGIYVLKPLKPMWKARAWWIYRGLRLGGGPAADPKNKKRLCIF